MCPSYRVTRDERDVTRGRANTLRLAITGQLGPDALHLGRDGGDAEALRLLQGLPARMPDRRRHGAHEDRGAGGAGAKSTGCRCTTGWSAVCRATRRYAAKVPWLLNLRDCAARRGEAVGGDRGLLRAAQRCRAGARDVFRRSATRRLAPPNGREVVLFADTFNRYFERENLDAALAVLDAPAAIASMSRSRRTTRRVRCAAAAPSSSIGAGR